MMLDLNFVNLQSYLCLPAHRSLSEGHCLIVPMQHVSAATALDEDVWQEMQVKLIDKEVDSSGFLHYI